MASLKPYTVYTFNNHGVSVTPEHTPYNAADHGHSEPPASTHKVQATSVLGAIREALMSAVRGKDDKGASEYKLTIGEQADLTLNRMAQEQSCTVSDILRNSINTYATLRRMSDDGYVYVKRRVHGKLVVSRVAIP